MSAASKCDWCGIYSESSPSYNSRRPFMGTPDGWIIVEVGRIPEQPDCALHGEFCTFDCASAWVANEGRRITKDAIEAHLSGHADTTTRTEALR